MHACIACSLKCLASSSDSLARSGQAMQLQCKQHIDAGRPGVAMMCPALGEGTRTTWWREDPVTDLRERILNGAHDVGALRDDAPVQLNDREQPRGHLGQELRRLVSCSASWRSRSLSMPPPMPGQLPVCPSPALPAATVPGSCRAPRRACKSLETDQEARPPRLESPVAGKAAAAPRLGVVRFKGGE